MDSNAVPGMTPLCSAVRQKTLEAALHILLAAMLPPVLPHEFPAVSLFRRPLEEWRVLHAPSGHHRAARSAVAPARPCRRMTERRSTPPDSGPRAGASGSDTRSRSDTGRDERATAQRPSWRQIRSRPAALNAGLPPRMTSNSRWSFSISVIKSRSDRVRSMGRLSIGAMWRTVCPTLPRRRSGRAPACGRRQLLVAGQDQANARDGIASHWLRPRSISRASRQVPLAERTRVG